MTNAFGCGRTPTWCAAQRPRSTFDLLREAEVRHFQVTFGIDQKILRLESTAGKRRVRRSLVSTFKSR